MAGSTASGEVTVRLATRDDMPRVHTMIHELATYEGVPDGPRLSVDDLIKDGFECSPPWFFALMAEISGEVVGYAICNRAYSSWTRRAFYLEDLYVVPSARRRGIASHIMQTLCQMALAEDVHRVDWHVLEDNAPARALYARLGAVDLRAGEGRAALRLHRPAVEAAAHRRPPPPAAAALTNTSF